MRCSQCDRRDLQPGFVEDSGEGSRGYARWIEGALERGVFGGAKRLGKPRWIIDAYRCTHCSHLEFFARPPE
ncbi:hypothetical protein [Sphaerisporangium perillae]|uniref:hypothetical protein n=1 Tax=Sphaerisporangium perillae TaxID=2935860 RepID=UPI00200F869F|nr:hypothetical protein [Sphaerisporangium perillae]